MNSTTRYGKWKLTPIIVSPATDGDGTYQWFFTNRVTKEYCGTEDPVRGFTDSFLTILRLVRKDNQNDQR